MANAFSNPTVVAKDALRHLKNNCVMGRLVNRGYEEEFKKPIMDGIRAMQLQSMPLFIFVRKQVVRLTLST